MELSDQSHRLVLVSKQDIAEAAARVAQKKDRKAIPSQQAIYGKLGEMLTEFYLQRVLAVLKFVDPPVQRSPGTWVQVTQFQNVDLIVKYTEQDAGSRSAYADPDFFFVNLSIEKDEELSEEEKKRTRFLMEIKSKSCIIKKHPGRDPEKFWKDYINDPEVLYTINETDYAQLIRHPAGFTLIWGLYVDDMEGKKEVIKAYCYFFSNEEILRMLYAEAGMAVKGSRALDNNAFMQLQTSKVWNKRMIRENITQRKHTPSSGEEIDTEDPFYRMYCELRQTEYASREKTLLFEKSVDEDGKPLVDKNGKEISVQGKKILKNTRESLRSDADIIRQGYEYYPKGNLIKLLKEGRTPRGAV